MSDDDLALIVNAVDNGLDPALMIEGPALWMNSKLEWERGSVRASLFGLALETYEIPIVEACLRNGANAKTSRIVAKKLGRQESFYLDESAIGQIERVLKECDERFPLEADDPVFIASEKLKQLLVDHGFHSEASHPGVNLTKEDEDWLRHD